MRSTYRVLKGFDKEYLRHMKVSRTASDRVKGTKPMPPPVNREFVRKMDFGGAFEGAKYQGRLGPGKLRTPEDIHRYLSEYRTLATDTFLRREVVLAKSKDAFTGGKGWLAKELSGEAQRLFELGAQYNAVAAARIFNHHNPSLESSVVDLHGLYVKEAQYYFCEHLQRCIKRGDTIMECVVGVGKNSSPQGATVLPAIVELCEKLDIFVESYEKSPRICMGTLLIKADSPFSAQSGQWAIAGSQNGPHAKMSP